MGPKKEVLDIDASGSVTLCNGSPIMADTDPYAMLRTTSCHACGAEPSDGQKLQKCGGCNIALYCSREFQKAAWKGHRFVCRQTNTTRAMHRAMEEDSIRHDQENGSGSREFSPGASEVPLVGLAGFNRFMTMHTWAIETMCQASLHLMNDGRGAESIRHNPIVMRFEVFPTADLRAKPWNAWTLKGWRHRSLNDSLAKDSSFAKAWEEQKAQRERQEAKDRIKFGARFVGELPVIFYVDKTHSMLIAQYPILKLRDPDALQTPEARGALDDLIALCLGYTNMGIPLGLMSGCEMVAFPGRVVRMKEKKGWGWLPRGTMERPWDDLWEEIFRHVGRKTDLPPMDLMLLFWNLTAEEYCRGLVLGPSDPSPEALKRPVLPTQHTRI
ncbi:hypothetical protein C8T65DRAFT_639834 [Cerioporus squamosus]|nr:hypothetical protein C8T65DRAFT_639834 [Cerioporus squamosus]